MRTSCCHVYIVRNTLENHSGLWCIWSPSKKHWVWGGDPSQMGYQSNCRAHQHSHLGPVYITFTSSNQHVLGDRRKPEDSEKTHGENMHRNITQTLTQSWNWELWSCEVTTLISLSERVDFEETYRDLRTACEPLVCLFVGNYGQKETMQLKQKVFIGNLFSKLL